MSNRKVSKRKIVKIFFAVICLCGIAMAAGYTLFIKPGLDKAITVYKENTAGFGPLKSTVTESGSVAFGIVNQVYDLDVSTDDSEDEDDDEEDEEKYLKVEEVYAAVGQRVKEGDAIYKFTQDSIDSVRKALKYSVTEAKIELANAQTDYDTGVVTAGLSYDETQLDTALSQQTYDNTIARLNNDMAAKTLEIEQLLAEIYKTQTDLVDDDYREQRSDIIEAYEKAQKAVEDAKEDFVTNRVTAADTFRTARDAYEEFFDKYDESNDSIQENVDKVYELQAEIENDQKLMEKDLLTANQTLEMSALKGSIADSQYASSIKEYETTLEKSKEALDEANEKLDAFEEFVGDEGIVYAANTGLVTEVGYSEGDSLVSSGTLISYATSDAMTISVDAAQEDVVTMKVGDSVDIVFSAYPDETYNGTIKSITTTATSRDSVTVSYPVVISILGDTSKLYGGMTANVTFVTEQTEDIVYVPRKAVVNENDKTYVYKKSGEDYVLSPVTTGFTNGEYIEIIAGLEEGETYYIESIASKEETISEGNQNNGAVNENNSGKERK